jgi:immune inhibitor A
VSPHPDLLSRLAAEGQGSTTTPSLLSVQPRLSRLSAATGTALGLNDGVIFPESHFAETPSTTSLATRLSRAALERAPLRGAVRYVIALVILTDSSRPQLN